MYSKTHADEKICEGLWVVSAVYTRLLQIDALKEERSVLAVSVVTGLGLGRCRSPCLRQLQLTGLAGLHVVDRVLELGLIGQLHY